MAAVYVLVDPRTGDVRYIGQTTQLPLKRLAQHVRKARLKPEHHRDFWIAQLLALGLAPGLVVIQEVPAARLDEYERHWIAAYKSRGAALTNMTPGGDGWYGRSRRPRVVRRGRRTRSITVVRGSARTATTSRTSMKTIAQNWHEAQLRMGRGVTP